MIFITGAAGAGKTSLVTQLKKKLPKAKYDIHDIDESGKWTDDYESWRDAKLEYWLKKSIKNHKKGIETILCGIIYPENVQKAASYNKAKPVKYILLDASPSSIRDRFYKTIEHRIVRHIEIAKELRNDLNKLQEKEIVNTTSSTIAVVTKDVLDLLKRK